MSSDNQTKLSQELRPNPHVHSFLMFAVWGIQCFDNSLWKIKRPPSHCSVLSMRSGTLPVSQSLPDDSHSWTGISWALGRDQREDWLLSKRAVRAEVGRERYSLNIECLRRQWILSPRHFKLLPYFFQKTTSLWVLALLLICMCSLALCKFRHTSEREHSILKAIPAAISFSTHGPKRE